MEDEEEFYDSLEEDQNFEDTVEDLVEILQDDEIVPKNGTSEEISVYESGVALQIDPVKSVHESNATVQKDPVKLTCENDVTVQKDPVKLICENDVAVQKDHVKTTKIPLYVGETDKRDLKINKKSTQNVAPVNQSSNPCLLSVAPRKSKVKIENVLPKKKQESSYWNIYCQKNGLPVEDEANNTTDTVRSLYGSTTNRTFSSFISSCCLSGNTWDAPSMFEKYMPKTYATPKNELPPFEEMDQNSIITKCNSADIDVNNLRSVSQIDIIKAPKHSPSKISANKIMKSQSNTSNISLRPLTLKSLGPDQSKLDLLKRQQEYGHRASSRNRARIIQNLSKIKQEIQDNSQERIKITR